MRLKVVDSQRCVGCQCCMFACSRRSGNAGLAESCVNVVSTGGISKGFRVVVCRGCKEPPCAKACPVEALEIKPKGGVKLRPDLCVGCKACVDACILGAVQWNNEEGKPLICVQCGICVKYCPHNVLQIVKD